MATKKKSPKKAAPKKDAFGLDRKPPTAKLKELFNPLFMTPDDFSQREWEIAATEPWGPPPSSPKRSFWLRLKDAYKGMVDGWRFGGW